MPQRIQRKRTKGWATPICSCGCGRKAIYVGRPTIYGNPFEVVRLSCGCWENRDDNGVTYMHSYPIHKLGHPPITRREAVDNSVRLFREDLTQWLGGRIEFEDGLADAIGRLRGHDLMCWCPLDQPCHADVLLELANGGEA